MLFKMMTMISLYNLFNLLSHFLSFNCHIFTCPATLLFIFLFFSHHVSNKQLVFGKHSSTDITFTSFSSLKSYPFLALHTDLKIVNFSTSFLNCPYYNSVKAVYQSLDPLTFSVLLTPTITIRNFFKAICKAFHMPIKISHDYTLTTCHYFCI